MGRKSTPDTLPDLEPAMEVGEILLKPAALDDTPLEKRPHADLLALAKHCKVVLPAGYVSKEDLIRLLREG